MLPVDLIASWLLQILLAFGLKAVKLCSVTLHEVLVVPNSTRLRVLSQHLLDLVRCYGGGSTDKTALLCSLFQTLYALAFGLVDGRKVATALILLLPFCERVNPLFKGAP